MSLATKARRSVKVFLYKNYVEYSKDIFTQYLS